MKQTFALAVAMTALSGQADAQLIEEFYSHWDLTIVLGDAGHDCDVSYLDGNITVQVLTAEVDPVTGQRQEIYLRKFGWSELENLTVRMGAGKDSFWIDDFIPVRCVVYGGGGNDAISGGMMGDELYGEAGKDIINGGAGDDLLYTGADGIREIMLGGEGKDWFFIPSYCSNDLFGTADKSDSKTAEKPLAKNRDAESKQSEKDAGSMEKDGRGWAQIGVPDAEDLISNTESWGERHSFGLGRLSDRPQIICTEVEEDWALDFAPEEDRIVLVPQN
ncbi:MAG: hypothetical protein ABJZ55_05335 [Fuerstiella sp.]